MESDKSPSLLLEIGAPVLFTVALCAAMASALPLPGRHQARALMPQDDLGSPPIVNKLQGDIEARASFAAENGGSFDVQHLPDGSTVLVEKCPMTAEEQRQFGHVPCPEMTVEEYKKAGNVQVGKANYTWADDSVLDLGALASMNELSVEDGVYRDRFGYVACFSRTNDVREIIDTPLGPGKVYDIGGDWYTIGIFVAA